MNDTLRVVGHVGYFVIIVAAWSVALCESVGAADRFWITTTGGYFANSLNWSTASGGAGGAAVPTSADVANFTLAGTYEVDFAGAGSVTNQRAEVENGTVSFNLANTTYTLSGAPSVSAVVGNVAGQTARWTLRNGTVAVSDVGDDIIVASPAGSTAFLTVTDGANLGASNPPDLILGASGTGTLTISNGGLVHANTTTLGLNDLAVGSATVSGATSVWNTDGNFTVGSSAQGSVTINGGGTVTSGFAVAGAGDDAAGTVSVSGTGSTWNSSDDFTVGLDGLGTLTVSGGGALKNLDSTVGHFGTGRGIVTITGAGSSWNHASIWVGIIGRGQLTVSSGGSVASESTAWLGSNSGGRGDVKVTGAGSVWTVGSALLLGDSGTGALDIESGGTVTSGSSTVGYGASGVGEVNVSGEGSSWAITGGLSIATGGTGTVSVKEGANLAVSGGLTIGDPAGNAIGVLNLRGGAITAGSLTRNGTLNWTDGTLTIRGGTFDNGVAASALTLDGATDTDLPTLRLIGAGSFSEVTTVTVGQAHRAAFEVLDGRGIDLGANSLQIGSSAGSDGSVSVRGAGASLAASVIGVGGSSSSAGGAGRLHVASGGLVSTVALRLWPAGNVQLDGGTLVLNSLDVGGGTFDWTAGCITFNGSPTLDSSNLDALLGPGHVLGGDRMLSTSGGGSASLSAPLTVDGGSASFSGTLHNSSVLTLRDGLVDAANFDNAAGARLVLTDVGRMSLPSGLLTNAGTIQLASDSAALTGGTLVNGGTIRGSGTISMQVSNGASGQIQTTPGNRIQFGSPLTNSASISLVGGEIQFDATVTNHATTGLVAARDAILRFNGSLTNNGSLAVTFGTADIFGDIANSATGRMVVSGGAQATFYDDVVNSGSINVSATGGLQSTAVFFGSLSGNGVSGGGRVFNEGDLRPGFSPGTMSFGGDLSFGPLAELEIEIGGIAPGTQHDRVAVASAVFLDGTLEVSTIGGYSPTLPGQTFTVVTAAERTGEFADVIGMPSASLPGLFWTVSYTPTSAILSTSALPGDIDLDGDVDRTDAAVFSRHFATTGGAIWTTGDFNGDGRSSLDDLSLLQAHLGQFNAPSPSFAAVPEPSALPMALCAAVGGLFASLWRPCVRRVLRFAGAALGIAGIGSSAIASGAYFSVQGTFSAPSGAFQDLLVSIDSPLAATFRTFASGGGTNAAGQAIPPGGIDSILTLYDLNNNLLAQNDDSGGTVDSLIENVVAPQEGFRLRLTNYGAAIGDGHWAMDVFHQTSILFTRMTLTAMNGNSSHVSDLSFGGTRDAVLQVGSGTSLSVGNLTARDNGAITITGGNLYVAGDERVGGFGGANPFNSPVTHSGGRHEVTGDLTLFNPYELSAGELSIGGSLYLGLSSYGGGSPGFNQTGASVTIGQTLWIDAFRTYNLSGGTLSAALIDVGSAASLAIGTGAVANASILELNSPSAVKIEGGALNVGQVVRRSSGASLAHGYGTLNLTNSNLLVGNGGLLGPAVALPIGRNLGVSGVTEIQAGGLLTIDGGSFATGELLNGGAVDFRRGTLKVTNSTLAVAGSGPLGGFIALGAGQSIDVALAATIAADASLVLQSGGSFRAGSLTNRGSIFLDGVNSVLGGGLLVNDGVLRGDGTIAASVRNGAAGEVVVPQGKTLRLLAAPEANAGLINLQGGTAAFSTPLVNAVGGRITGRGAVKTSGTGLTNLGHIALSNGITDIFGDVVNASGVATRGISISGNADVTFWDDVGNAAGSLFRVSSGSSATFFGAYSGAGISGEGDVFFESDISPGFSPAIASFEGNVSLSSTAHLEMEIEGTTPGQQYDQLLVGGRLVLDGTLSLKFADGFVPSSGQTFKLWDAGSQLGQFDEVRVMHNAAEILWDLDPTGTVLILSSALAGDTDRDGDVDRVDVARFARHFGQTEGSTWESGDFDGDGGTTLVDLTRLHANLGRAVDAPAAAAIPEQSTLRAFLCGAFFVGMVTIWKRGCNRVNRPVDRVSPTSSPPPPNRLSPGACTDPSST